jgi:hypothetical protein
VTDLAPYANTAEWWDARSTVGKRNAELEPCLLADLYGGTRGAWSGRRGRAAVKMKDEVSFPPLRTGGSVRYVEPPPEPPDVGKLARYMSRGRTEAEITAKGYSVAEAKAVAGYDLFETRNQYQERVYLLLPQIAKVPLQPKVWTHRWATADGRPQPYLMVQMPERKWPKLKVVPIADVHYGSMSCMTDKLREYVNWIAENDNVFAFIGGDLFENAHGDSNHGISMYEQDVRPRSQIDQMAEILSPIAHRILWAIPGNHEDRSRSRDYDPLERLCDALEIPYSYEPVFVDVLWRGNVFAFYDQHGHTSSQTEGGKLNAAARPLEMQEFVHFCIMAHVRSGKVDDSTRICRDRVTFELKFRKQYIVICRSFYRYFGSYASKAGYKPGSYGSVNMDLFPNGDYHANS